MGERTRTSRWLERTAWTAFVMSIIAWLASVWVTIDIENNKYGISLNGGAVAVNFAPWPPDLVGASGPDTSVREEEPDSWSFDIAKIEDSVSISDRLSLEMPLLRFWFPCDFFARTPYWLSALLAGVLAVRIRRGPRMLTYRAARRRRRLGIAAFAGAGGFVALWIATQDYLDINFQMPIIYANVKQGMFDAETSYPEWPALTVRKQVINLNGTPGPLPEIALDGNIDSLSGFEFARFPAWLPAWLLVPLGICLRRSARFVQTGICIKCGYDLTGNTSGKCSECGRVIDGHFHGTRQ